MSRFLGGKHTLGSTLGMFGNGKFDSKNSEKVPGRKSKRSSSSPIIFKGCFGCKFSGL